MTCTELSGPSVLQVSPFIPREEREPRALLDDWWSLRDVARAASSAGCRVTVLQAASTEAQFELHDARFVFVATSSGSKLRTYGGLWTSRIPHELFRRARQIQADVIHFHSLSFPRHLRHLRKGLSDVPVLVQDHADRPPPRWRAFLHRWSLDGVAGVTFTAREQAQAFRKARALPPAIPVFPVPESSSSFRPGDVEAARSASGLHGDPCLVWLGNLSPVKDPLAVLEALSRAADSLPDVHLWCFYREAPLLGEARSRIARDPSLAGRVHLMGRVPHDQVEIRLQAADFLVQGSRREGSGYAVIEALACGTTPLVTDIPSFRAITGGGAVGALSPVGDAGAMAEALTRWAARDRKTLRRRAREHFDEHLSFESLGFRLRAAYEAAIRASS